MNNLKRTWIYSEEEKRHGVFLYMLCGRSFQRAAEMMGEPCTRDRIRSWVETYKHDGRFEEITAEAEEYFAKTLMTAAGTTLSVMMSNLEEADLRTQLLVFDRVMHYYNTFRDQPVQLTAQHKTVVSITEGEVKKEIEKVYGGLIKSISSGPVGNGLPESPPVVSGKLGADDGSNGSTVKGTEQE